jgi:hypothetical protein
MARDMDLEPSENRVEDRCPNHSATLKGSYCSSCGQRQVDLDQPFRELTGEAMKSFLSFDARILGRYVHPCKLYFAFSALLFLGLALCGYMVVLLLGYLVALIVTMTLTLALTAVTV